MGVQYRDHGPGAWRRRLGAERVSNVNEGASLWMLKSKSRGTSTALAG